MKDEIKIDIFIDCSKIDRDINFLLRRLKNLDSSPKWMKSMIETRIGMYLLKKFCAWYLFIASKFWMK